MSSNNHVPGRFTVQDITFHGARHQSEILKENATNTEVEDSSVDIPQSLTPEQLVVFYTDKMNSTPNVQEKRIYAHTIKALKTYHELRVELRTEKNKNEVLSQELEDLKTTGIKE